MNNLIHEDTLEALKFVAERLEENLWEWRHDSGRYEDVAHCSYCRAEYNEYARTRLAEKDRDNDMQHESNCKLINSLKIAQAFIAIEQKKLDEFNIKTG